jgi:glycosyltransferase 2 family protein
MTSAAASTPPGGLSTRRKLAHVALGVAIGASFAWITFYQTVPREAADAIVRVDPHWLGAAVAFHALSIALRVLRWRCLLGHLVRLPYGAFARVLIVGHGVNLLMPVRLGELFRVEYFKRNYGVARAWSMSSIMIERMLDLMTVVACLSAGLSLSNMHPERMLIVLSSMGSILFIILCTSLVLLVWLARQRWVRRWRYARHHLAMIGPAVQVMGKTAFLVASGVTPLIHALEAAALASVLHGLGVDVTPTLALVVVGAASLSTFLPSAPAYIGTYQYAFMLALQQLGLNGALGVAAATLVQLVLFGPVVVAALAVMAVGARLYWRFRPA